MDNQPPKSTQSPNEYVVVAPPPVAAYSAEWAALSFLKRWTPEDIQIAIRKDIEVDLSSFMGKFMKDMVCKIVDEVLNWFKVYRPDLYGALATKEGILWIEANVRRMVKKTIQR